MYRHFLSFWQLQLINLGRSSIAVKLGKQYYIHLNLAYCSQSTPLSPCNHMNINCWSDWTDQGRGVPLRLGTFGCEKIYWYLLWKIR